MSKLWMLCILFVPGCASAPSSPWPSVTEVCAAHQGVALTVSDDHETAVLCNDGFQQVLDQ